MPTLRIALRRHLERRRAGEGKTVPAARDAAGGSGYDARIPSRLTVIRRLGLDPDTLTFLSETPVDTALTRGAGAIVPAASPAAPRPDLVVAAWLAAKAERSGSAKTQRAYTDAIAGFRQLLARAELDLDADPQIVGLAAQGWAGQGAPAPATFNQRLAILSSFYSYAIKQGALSENPIARVDRRPTQAYAAARALDAGDVAERLAAIDRATLEGQRDYTVLLVALTTGRRLAEVAGLLWGDVEVRGRNVTLHFRRTKGGKQMRDTLASDVGLALLTYLQAREGQLRGLAPATKLWPLTPRSLERVCQRRLGTGRFHSLRHTFAHELETAGAKLSEIQAKLGHRSAATTGIYLAALKSDENPYADDLAARFGL